MPIEPQGSAGSDLNPVRIVLTPDLASRFHGDPPLLLERFGDFPTLLRATVDRVAAAALAPVVVCYRDQLVNQPIASLLEGAPVRVCKGPPHASEPQLVLSALEQTAGQTAIIVDPRAALVSATVLGSQLQAHLRDDNDYVLCPLVPPGLAGIVASRPGLERLAQAYRRESRWDINLDLASLADKIRSACEVIDAEVDERFRCLAISLLPQTAEQVRLLARLALGPDREDYEAVFAALCAQEWNRWSDAYGLTPRVPATRPKLLFVHYTNRREAGSTRVFEMMLQHWDHTANEIVVVLPSQGELYERLAPKYPIRFLRSRWICSEPDLLPGGRWIAELATARDLLQAENPALVLVSGTLPPLAMACRLAGIPCLCHIHLPLLSYEPAVVGKLARAAALPLYDLVVATAQWYEHGLRALFRPPAGRLTSVPLGIELERFRNDSIDRARARARFGVPESARVIAVVGLLQRVKQPQLAVEALPQILERIDDAILLFAGGEPLSDPGFRADLERRATRLGVLDRIRFLGFVHDVSSVYACADILLHCALGESFGLVLVEAMAMGRPVVAIRAGGPAEIVVDRVTGRLIPPPGNPADVAAAVSELLADCEQLETMGSAACRRAHEEFGLPVFIGRMTTLCQRLITRTEIATSAPA
jgi:glycosyltransferase involved in cell wall biosynthesis